MPKGWIQQAPALEKLAVEKLSLKKSKSKNLAMRTRAQFRRDSKNKNPSLWSTNEHRDKNRTPNSVGALKKNVAGAVRVCRGGGGSASHASVCTRSS